MRTKRFFFYLGLAAVVVVAIGCATLWFVNRKPADGGKPEPKAGGSSLLAGSFCAPEGSFNADQMPALLVRDVRGLLHLPQKSTAYQLFLRNQRCGRNLITTLWSGGTAVDIDTVVRSCEKSRVAPDWREFHLEPAAHHEYSLTDDVLFIVKQEGEKSELQIRRDQKVLGTVPWRHNSMVFVQWSYEGYPLAFGQSEDTLSHRPVSAVVIDKRTNALVGEVNFPIADETPEMSLDADNDCAIFFDHRLGWMLVLDLQKMVDAKEKPKEPKWPHCAGPAR